MLSLLFKRERKAYNKWDKVSFKKKMIIYITRLFKENFILSSIKLIKVIATIVLKIFYFFPGLLGLGIVGFWTW